MQPSGQSLRLRFLKQPGFTSLRVCLNFYWKLFEWITARYEKIIPDWHECNHIALKPKPFSEAKTDFFNTSRNPRVLSEKI